MELVSITYNCIRHVIYKSESGAKTHVINKLFGASNTHKYASISYNDLFDSKKSEIYLKNLKDLINTDWPYFMDYFQISQEIFINCMDVLNKEGRFDAHANIPDNDEMILVEGAYNKIKKGIDTYNEQ